MVLLNTFIQFNFSDADIAFEGYVYHSIADRVMKEVQPL
jgi:hypothetical protein